MTTRVKRTPKKTPVSRALGVVIAERTLTAVERAHARVRVRIGKPRRDRETGDTFCPFLIEGLGDRKVHEAWGVDSVQALQNAMQAIRLALDPHARGLSWAGGQDGWLGFPKAIPDLFGPGLTSRLETMVAQEVDRFARGLESTHGPSKRRRHRSPTRPG